MKKINIGFRVKEYLFHLNNANDENGIRPAEGWKFEKVDLAGKKAIENAYYPAVSTEVGVAQMDSFSEKVMRGLNTDHPKIYVSDTKIESSVGANHFIAFCTNRPRR